MTNIDVRPVIRFYSKKKCIQRLKFRLKVKADESIIILRGFISNLTVLVNT